MNAASDAEAFVFAGFCLDSRQRLLFGPDDRPVPLTGRAFDMLLYLVEHPNELVGKQALMKAVWPSVIVEDNNINQNISIVRRALGETAGENRFIVTVPGRGFRFVPVVTRRARSQRVELSAPARIGRDRKAAADSGPSIAVLPFANMGADKEQDYFSDGLAEELLNQLAQLPGLRVIGRTSSFAFKGRNEDLGKIATTLNVNHLLEGSVRKHANRVRITVQLVDPSDGSYVWSQAYERTLDDIFAIQEDIGRTVAAALRLKFDDGPSAIGGTRSFAAFDEFLAGRARLNSNEPASMSASSAHLERAVALDAGYLNAWIWLIDSYTRSAVIDVKHRAHVKAAQQRAIERVCELAPESVFATIAKSYGALATGDLKGAAALLESAVGAPAGVRGRVRVRYSHFLLCVGRSAAAIEQSMQARSEDPLDVWVRASLAAALEVGGQLERADAELAQVLALPGGDSAYLRTHQEVLWAALAERGTRSVQGEESQSRLLAAREHPHAALRELQSKLDDAFTGADLFEVGAVMQSAAFLGDAELSLNAARRLAALGVSFETWAWLLWRPIMQRVRRLPAFRDFLRELRLVDYWRAMGNWGDFCRPAGPNDFECS
jgi:TolB-like protein